MIDPIFNMFKVKFDVMDKLHLVKCDTQRVIFYINLENVFKVLFNPKVNNYIKALNDPKYVKMLLCSNILNLASHYKLYCAKMGLDCKVIMYMNYPKMDELDNKNYVPFYKEYLSHKLTKNNDTYMVTKNVNDILDMCNIIVKYLDDIYLINSTSIESSVIPYITYKMKFNDSSIKTQHIIIANTKYEYQYTNYNFSILEPKGDESIIVNMDNVYNVLKSKLNIKNDKVISTSFLPMIITILGDKYRNIDKIAGVGLSHVMNMIHEAIQQYLVTDNTTNVDMIAGIIAEDFREDFINRYKTVEVSGQFSRASDYSIDLIMEQFEDKFDEYTLAAINDKYFKRSPLFIIDNKKQKFNERIREERTNEEEGKSIFE